MFSPLIWDFKYTGSPHFTRFHFARSSLYTRFIIVPNEFTLCNALHDFLTLHCQKTLSELYLSTKGTVFHFTRISLYTIYFEKQKSCKVRATCTYLHTDSHIYYLYGPNHLLPHKWRIFRRKRIYQETFLPLTTSA